MTYFITGGTGFIGSRLIEQLLKRDATIYVLVRDESLEKFQALLAQRWHDSKAIKPVVGNITKPQLGVDQRLLDELTDQVDHFFHVAAIYDMTADPQANHAVNVDGTRNAVAFANSINAGIFHHMSSVAVAGEHEGLFTEDSFDVGQKLDHPYHRTKFEAEQIVRAEVKTKWRVYRPAIVVGDSRTGEIDKIDGPYYFFKAIQKVRHYLPEWFPLFGIEVGNTNIVPVDYVTAAVDHIAHQPDLDQQAFHLVNPQMQKVGEVINAFAQAGHAPQLVMRVDRKLTDMLPKGVLSLLLRLPTLREVRRSLLADFGVPEAVVGHVAFTAIFDDRDAQRALTGTEITVPPINSYATQLWDYWERNLDPDLFKDHSFAGAVRGKRVVITGASSGIGRAAALKVARAGGIPILVARSQEKLDDTREEIEARGGQAFTYSADLSNKEAIDKLLKDILSDHPAIDVLVNNAGRSIRRSIEHSYDRFHDFERTMQLNYFGAIQLIIGLLPHMRERKSGHIVNISSIGVQTNTPRFSAYVASKAALDAFTRVVSSETIGDRVTFTTIHMPLVRTPMIAPTKIYDQFPTITPEEAADLICEAIRKKPKQINTRLGTFGEIAYAIAPKAVDQVLHLAYKVFPESAASRGEKIEGEHASGEAVALAYLMRGIHW